jgi:5-methylcytosine-specific restriction protein A
VRLMHTANDQFRGVGVVPGDRVYIVGTEAGRLLLLSRLIVERVVGQSEADREFGQGTYEASDHLIGDRATLRLDRVVPEDVARRIERESGKRLKIAPSAYQVDVNSLRRTGRLTEASAALLEGLLDDKIKVVADVGGIAEGKRHERRHAAIERSSVLRRLALARQGSDCKVCGFSFGGTYGPLGDGFAEIHHLKPLGSLREEMLVDPVADVVVLCANCHRMIHRDSPPLTPEHLRRLLGTAADPT